MIQYIIIFMQNKHSASVCICWYLIMVSYLCQDWFTCQHGIKLNKLTLCPIINNGQGHMGYWVFYCWRYWDEPVYANDQETILFYTQTLPRRSRSQLKVVVMSNKSCPLFVILRPVNKKIFVKVCVKRDPRNSWKREKIKSPALVAFYDLNF